MYLFYLSAAASFSYKIAWKINAKVVLCKYKHLKMIISPHVIKLMICVAHMLLFNLDIVCLYSIYNYCIKRNNQIKALSFVTHMLLNGHLFGQIAFISNRVLTCVYHNAKCKRLVAA